MSNALEKEIAPLDGAGGDSQGILRIAKEDSPSTVQDTSDDFRANAKLFEPATGAIVNICDGVTFKLLRNRLRKVTDDEDKAVAIASLARLSKESKDAAKQAGARIAARRTKSGEAMDVAVLLGVAAEWGAGLAEVLGEIRKLEEKQEDLAQRQFALQHKEQSESGN